MLFKRHWLVVNDFLFFEKGESFPSWNFSICVPLYPTNLLSLNFSHCLLFLPLESLDEQEPNVVNISLSYWFLLLIFLFSIHIRTLKHLLTIYLLIVSVRHRWVVKSVKSPSFYCSSGQFYCSRCLFIFGFYCCHY